MKNCCLLVFCFLLFGCEENAGLVLFEKPIKGRTVDLSAFVGDEFLVLRGQDTIDYAISFDRKNDINYLIKSVEDTVFSGSITKRNELFLLNKSLDNGLFKIQVLKFSDSTVVGLNSLRKQKQILKQLLYTEEYDDLLVDSATFITAAANKSRGRSLFRQVLDSLPQEMLVSSDIAHAPNPVESPFKSEQLIANVSPNPSSNYVKVDFVKSGTYSYVLQDASGNKIKSGKVSGLQLEIDISELENGLYMIAAAEDETQQRQVVRIIKSD